MKDLSILISKLMGVGFSLPDVIGRSTWKPVQVILRPELEHLNVGAEADVAVWVLNGIAA